MDFESSGEKQIRRTLEQDLKIKFEQEKEIYGLIGDSAKFRRADFYLPDYDLYIEFLGGWDHPDFSEREKERKRYNEKKRIYSKNNIKCIYIYPSHLKSLEYILKNKIENPSQKFKYNENKNSVIDSKFNNIFKNKKIMDLELLKIIGIVSFILIIIVSAYPVVFWILFFMGLAIGFIIYLDRK